MSLVAFPESPEALSPPGLPSTFNPQASLTQTTKCQQLRSSPWGRDWVLARWFGATSRMQHLARHPPPW